MDAKKERLDKVVVQRYPNLSRSYIQECIAQGDVRVNDIVVTRPGIKVGSRDTVICSLTEPCFVSRAGFKLERALDHFKLDVRGFVVLDAGISTGGFTDCLLQRGAQRVYGVDVGQGQVHPKIKADERVILYEKTNIRHLAKLPEKVDLITLDLSFISLLKVFPSVIRFLKKAGCIVALIKPQFEVGREHSKDGIIKDPRLHQLVIERIQAGAAQLGLDVLEVIPSPLLGGSGNREFLALIGHAVV